MIWLALMRVYKRYCLVGFHMSEEAGYYSADHCPKDTHNVAKSLFFKMSNVFFMPKSSDFKMLAS